MSDWYKEDRTVELELDEEDIKQGVTLHQKTIHYHTTNGGDTCPSCKSNGGQFLDIENPGESWTQTHCAYGCGYLNLDDYYHGRKKKENKNN
jgi:hypothetical protein